jgi:sporulation protein YlmC with PRC-barrel domain
MTSEQIRQRSDLLGTQVITRSTGRRLGVVSQLWVDIDRREVVALGLKESMLSGVMSNTQQMMMLTSIRQIGDVILVDDDMVLEDDLNVEAYSSLINCEVITETGELLGKVRGFKFNANTGKVMSLIIASLGIPLIPDQIVSTYELSIEEVVSSGPDRLIVFEGAEDKLAQLTVGLLERLGIGKPPWERDEDEDYYVMPTSTSNQLGTGTRISEPMRTVAPSARDNWDDDNWDEQSRRKVREPLRQRQAEPEYYEEPIRYEEPLRQRPPEPVYYDESEEDNWSDNEDEYDDEEDIPYVDYRQADDQPEYVEEDEEITNDVWEDDENPAPLNIPERKRVVEYEEEPDY